MPWEEVNPSKPQMKALQQLRAGALLVIRTWPSRSVHIEAANGIDWMFIHPSTARIIVAHGWVELKKFTTKRGEYRLHKSGLKLTEAFCEHKHERDETMQTVDARMVCRACWLVVPCGGELHPAHFWRWGIGAICEGHAMKKTG